MSCGCGKNRPKLNQGPRNPSIIAQANQQNYVLRVNNTPRPNISAQQITPNIQVQVNGEVVSQSLNHPANAEVSPAGLDAHKRRVEALRRAAIRNALNK